MSRHTFEEMGQLRESAKTLIKDVGESRSLEELEEHIEYGSTLIPMLHSEGICTDEEATEWKFQLGLAKAQATERLENLA